MVPLSPSAAIRRKTLFTRIPISASSGEQAIWVVSLGPSSSLTIARIYGVVFSNWSLADRITV